MPNTSLAIKLPIAEQLGVSRPTVQLWRKRVRAQGIGGVWEIAPGRGRKPQYDQATRDGIIQATLRSKPKGMTHWSCRLMAASQEVSKNTVNRLWQLHNLKPHLSRTFKLSRDAKFLEKLTDVVAAGLSWEPWRARTMWRQRHLLWRALCGSPFFQLRPFSRLGVVFEPPGQDAGAVFG